MIGALSGFPTADRGLAVGKVTLDQVNHHRAKLLAAVAAAEAIGQFFLHLPRGFRIRAAEHPKKVVQQNIDPLVGSELTDPGHRFLEDLLAIGVGAHEEKIGSGNRCSKQAAAYRDA